MGLFPIAGKTANVFVVVTFKYPNRVVNIEGGKNI
jgi:hypothetical protein